MKMQISSFRNKVVSLILAAALMVTMLTTASIPAFAAENDNNYYTTVANLNYETASPLTSKTDGVSITTLYNGSIGYMQANNTTSSAQDWSYDGFGFEANTEYKLSVSFYLLSYASGNTLMRVDVPKDGGLANNYLNNSGYNLNQWYSFEKTFTLTADAQSFFRLYTFGGSNMLIDNITYTRVSDGAVISSRDFEDKAQVGSANSCFTWTYDYSAGSAGGDEKALHLKSTGTANDISTQSGTIGGLGIGSNIIKAGSYKMSFRYMILSPQTTTASLYAFAVQLTNWCPEHESRLTFDYDSYISDVAAAGTWTTVEKDVVLDTDCNYFFTVSLFNGAEILLDDVKLIPTDSNTVSMNYDFNNGSVPQGDILTSFAGEIEFFTVNKLLWSMGAPNVENGHLKIDTTECQSEHYVDVSFNLPAAIASTSYPHIVYKYRVLDGTTVAAGGDMLAISLNGKTGSNNIQFIKNSTGGYNIGGYTVGAWGTSPNTTFTGVQMNAGINFIRIYCYPDMQIEIDDIAIYAQNGALLTTVDFETNGTFTPAVVEAPTEETDYAMYIDTTAQTGSYTRACVENAYALAAGNYTIRMKFYPTAVGSNGQINMRRVTGGGVEDAGDLYLAGSKMLLNTWQTYSTAITINKTAGINSHFFLYIWKGFVGYFDDFEILNSQGSVVHSVSLAANTSVTTWTSVANGGSVPSVAEAPAPTVATDYAMHVDTSAQTADYTRLFVDNSYALAAGTYTIRMNFYPTAVGSNGQINMRRTTGSNEDSGNLYLAGSKMLLNTWQTYSTTITINNTAGANSHFFLYIWKGFVGYFDDLEILNSQGNVVHSVAFAANTSVATWTTVANGGSVPTVAEAPAKEVPSDDYYSFIWESDGWGMNYYGSNGVLNINAGASNVRYSFDASNMGINLTVGESYRVTFDYDVLKAASSGSSFAVLYNSGGKDFINSGAGTKEYVFTTNTTWFALMAYAGANVVFDNIMVEKLVTATSSTAPVQLSAKKYIDGADTFVDVTVNTETSAKNFTFDLAYNGDYLEYISGTGENASISATDSGESLSVTAASTLTTGFIIKNQKPITGNIAVLTFRVYTAGDDTLSFTATNFSGVTDEILPVSVSFSNYVTSVGISKLESSTTPEKTGALVFGMQLAINDDGIENIKDNTVTSKGFLLSIGYQLKNELTLEDNNPYVKNVAVTAAQSSGTGYNRYTVAVNNPVADQRIAVRPYAVTSSGTYYGEELSCSADDLAKMEFGEWKTFTEVTSAAQLSISNTAAQNWMGANAISQGFIMTNGYTDEQIEIELDRIDNMDLNMVRSYYDQTFSAVYNSETKSIDYDWTTPEMQGLVKWIRAMDERGIDVALNMSWSITDVLYGHCTTYSGDDCTGSDDHGKGTNPFYYYSRRNSTTPDYPSVYLAYGAWVAASMDYLINTCHFDNITHLIMLTEPQQWTPYQSLVSAADAALKTAGLRNQLKLVGPNIGFMHKSYDELGGGTGTIETDLSTIIPMIKDYIDVYSFHFYAPNWPGEYGAAGQTPASADNYAKYVQYFNQFISAVNTYGKNGADYWFDEFNYAAGKGVDPAEGTQLSQVIAAALNSGVENVMLWQLFETKWTERTVTSDEFVNGVHAMGLAPTLTESAVPHYTYYAYSLLTKYMGQPGAKAYTGTGDNGVYTAMVENTDGTQSIMVVNTNQSAKTINLNIAKAINGTLLRHVYDPALVAPNADATIIAADKAFSDVTAGLTDVIPAGGVVIYTTDTSYTVSETDYYVKGGELTETMIANSRLNEGNQVRLAEKLDQLEQGGDFTVGYIGGSITQGFYADSDKSYADLTSQWLSDTYKSANITSVNAGIGATDSYLGVHRVENDLLAASPDLVFVEYAVNESASALALDTYDSLIQRIWNSENAPAIIMIATVQESGSSNQAQQKLISDAYDIPMISYGDTIMAEIANKTIKWTDISPDNIHPNNVGHKILSQLLQSFITDVANSRSEISGAESDLSVPYTSARFVDAQWLSSKNTIPDSISGFTSAPADTFEKITGFWNSSAAGDEMTFTVTAQSIGIARAMTTSGGSFEVYVDGSLKATLDCTASFNYNKGNEIASFAASGTHTVRIVSTGGTVRISGILIS